MTGTIEATSRRCRRAPTLLALAILCAGLVAVGVASSAGAERAKVSAKAAKVLGKTRHTPRPSCPKSCQGVGRVTGFMRVADGKKFPFKVRRNGKLVAFALDLSRPSKNQRNFFGTIFKGKRFGKAPSARIAVLRQSRQRRRTYQLLRQSPTVNLNGALGRKQIFTLDKPLRIRKGQVVAISIPSWASNFAHGRLSGNGNQWRASRSKRKCAPRNDSPDVVKRWARKSKSQQKVGSNRTYGCDYTGGRLLYWAYYAPA